MGGSSAQFGIGKETTYGTAVVQTKFYEIISEDFKGSYPRLQAEGLSASFVDRSDRFAVVPSKGAAGGVELEVLTKGFNAWLRYMMGDVTTSVVAETAAYTHTAIISSLFGDMITCQVGRPDSADVVQPWTYEGGKVTGFELSNQVDQTLRCKIDMDFEKESNPDSPTGAYVLATNVPVAGAEVLNWAGGTITIGGVVTDVSDFSVKVDNGLKVDTTYINKAALGKRQPTQNEKRKIEWEFKTPYVDNVFWEKVSSAQRAGASAVLSARWEGPTLITGATTIYPSLEIQIPVGVFDEGGPVVAGPSALEQSFKGRGLYNGTDSALSLVYVSADLTSL